MMDFYMDAHGHVANEFYKIDDEGNLIQIETGIKPIKDKTQIEKIFKQYFLPY